MISFIFSDILGLDYKKDKLLAIKEQFAVLQKYYTEHYAVTSMRKQILQYLKGENVSIETKMQIMSKETVTEVLDILDNIFC